jgi:ABC-type sugar transport system substrate-binding protein
MKRRVVMLVAALVLLPVLVVFASGGGEGKAGGKAFRIAVSLPPANNAWQAKMLDSVNAEVAKGSAPVE